jgi:hypothetical protein
MLGHQLNHVKYIVIFMSINALTDDKLIGTAGELQKSKRRKGRMPWKRSSIVGFCIGSWTMTFL